METCTEIETLRDSLMWDFFHTRYYPIVTFWSNNRRHVGFGFTNDSCV